MKHPAPETWMSYVYDETDSRERAELDAHLHECATCREAVANWRGTMSRLDEDHATLALPPRRARTGFRWQPVVRWALTACVVVCAGFAAGRYGTTSQEQFRTELATAREQMADEIRARYAEDLKTIVDAAVTATTLQNQEALASIKQEFVDARATDQRQLLTVLDRMELQRTEDYRRLSGGLVRLARQTGDGFKQAEEQLNTLASYMPEPANPQQDSKENKQ